MTSSNMEKHNIEGKKPVIKVKVNRASSAAHSNKADIPSADLEEQVKRGRASMHSRLNSLFESMP